MKHLTNFEKTSEAIEHKIQAKKVNLKDPKVQLKYDVVNPNPKMQEPLHIYQYNGVCFHVGKSENKTFYAIIGIPDAVDTDGNSMYYDSVVYAKTMAEMIKELPAAIDDFKKDNNIND